MQLTLFDYQQLDTETRIVVQQRTTEIKALMKRTAQDIIEIGEKLIEVKARLPHGAFGGWLEGEFEWGTTQAQRFMQVAERFGGQNHQIGEFAPSALYLLAAPSTPDDARAEAISRAETGERITHSTAKEIVNGHKQTPQATITTNPNAGPAPWEDEQPPAPDSRVVYIEPLKTLWCQSCGQKTTIDLRSLPQSSIITCTACGWSETGYGWRDVELTTPPPDDDLPEWLRDDDVAKEPLNYKRDAKSNREGSLYEPKGYDACQTPPHAIDPLLPYLPVNLVIWEPAAGENNLVEAFYDASRQCVYSDIITGQNFFDYEPDDEWDIIVTNPPYSIKYDWIRRCYELGKPFALLLPVETLGAATAQAMFSEHGVQVILLNKRINFKMPNKGWDGAGAQFPVCWVTWGLNLEDSLIFGQL